MFSEIPGISCIVWHESSCDSTGVEYASEFIPIRVWELCAYLEWRTYIYSMCDIMVNRPVYEWRQKILLWNAMHIVD